MAQPDDRVGGALVAAGPGLSRGGAHAVDQVVDGGLDRGAVDVGQLAADRQHAGVGLPPHPQRSGLAARTARPWPAAWPGCGRGGPDPRAACAPGRAHSASEASSARRARGASCSPEIVPACAAAATVGSDSRVRAVSTVSRSDRVDTPSAAASVSSTTPRSSSTATTASSSTRSRRCSRTNSACRATSHSVGRHRRSSTSAGYRTVPFTPGSSHGGMTLIARSDPSRSSVVVSMHRCARGVQCTRREAARMS